VIKVYALLCVLINLVPYRSVFSVAHCCKCSLRWRQSSNQIKFISSKPKYKI